MTIAQLGCGRQKFKFSPKYNKSCHHFRILYHTHKAATIAPTTRIPRPTTSGMCTLPDVPDVADVPNLTTSLNNLPHLLDYRAECGCNKACSRPRKLSRCGWTHITLPHAE